MNTAAELTGTAALPADSAQGEVVEYRSSLPNLADAPLQDWRKIVTSPVLLDWIEDPELATATGFHSSV